MKIKPGTCFYKAHDSKEYYIVTILPEPDNQVVYRSWARYRKRWCYEIKYLDSFNFFIKHGVFSDKRIT